MPQNVGELPPHPLDSAFEDCTSQRRADRGLENNPHYRQALESAVHAFESASNRPKDEVGPSPKRAACRAFLSAITGNGIGATGSTS